MSLTTACAISSSLPARSAGTWPFSCTFSAGRWLFWSGPLDFAVISDGKYLLFLISNPMSTCGCHVRAHPGAMLLTLILSF